MEDIGTYILHSYIFYIFLYILYIIIYVYIYIYTYSYMKTFFSDDK